MSVTRKNLGELDPGDLVRVVLETTLSDMTVGNMVVQLKCAKNVGWVGLEDIVSIERLRPELEGDWKWETNTSIIMYDDEGHPIVRLEREDGCTHVCMDGSRSPR